MSADFSVRYVGAISRALAHGCAISAEEVEKAVSLRHLNALMRAVGIGRNDSGTDEDHLRNYAYIPGIEGWEEFIPIYGGVGLLHTTISGRLEIEATTHEVILRFMAGPATKEEEKGQLVCELIFSDHMGLRNDVGLSIHGLNLSLLTGREDRIALLRDIDRGLNGEVFTLLKERKVRWGVEDSGVIALLDAWQVLDEETADAALKGN